MKSNYLGKELGSFQLLCSVFVRTSVCVCVCPLEGELEDAARLVSTFCKTQYELWNVSDPT